MGEKFGPRFFCPLLPGFSKKLLVPQELVKRICMSENRREATIVTSNAKIWFVDFYREMEDTYIGGDGWENFVKALGLRDFDLLVFRYRGNMVFTIRVFDKTTCCEKIYRKEKTIFICGDDQNSNIIQKPSKSSCKKRKGEGLTPIQISENSMTTRSQDQFSGEVERNHSRKLSFEITIKSFNFRKQRCPMRIPSQFVESAGRLLEHGELMLSEPKGRTWPVGLFKCRKSQNIYMSKGWMNFARASKLKAGDRCIFEFSPSLQGKKRLVNVEILNRTPTRWVDQTAGPVMRSGAHFEVTVESLYAQYVPVRFKACTALEMLSEVVLVNPAGRPWPVSLHHSSKQDGNNLRIQTYIKWKQFAVSNNIRKGDKVIFEQLPKKESDNVMQIQVRKG